MMRKRVLDVLLIRAHDEDRGCDDTELTEVLDLGRQMVPLSKQDDVALGWQDDLPPRELIARHCAPSWQWEGREQSLSPATRNSHYALVNLRPAKPEEANWDPDQRLTEYVALSRLMHPSAIDYEYCARLAQSVGGTWSIMPSMNKAPAYTAHNRTFLRLGEWQRTGELVDAWRGLKGTDDEAIRRIQNALWWREKAAREYYIEARWPMLVTAIESLVKPWKAAGRGGPTQDFKAGMLFLADLVNIEYSKKDALHAYDIRSSYTHGRPWPMRALRVAPSADGEVGDEERRRWLDKVCGLYKRTEAVFDKALRATLLDEGQRQRLIEHHQSILDSTQRKGKQGRKNTSKPTARPKKKTRAGTSPKKAKTSTRAGKKKTGSGSRKTKTGAGVKKAKAGRRVKKR